MPPSTAGPPLAPIALSPAERATLERWARGRRTARRLVRRARIVLQAAAGLSNAAIARACRTDRECVARWRARFRAARLAGLQHEAPRPGRPPKLPADLLQALATLLTTTAQAAGRPWSTRSLAREAGVSPASIRRCCQATGVAPHWVTPRRLRTPFPGFARLTEVLGGYLTPWESALVLGGDAVGDHRPAPPPAPPAPGGPARYAGRLPPLLRTIGGPPEVNRVFDWLQFLRHVAARVPRDRWVHVVVDSCVPLVHPGVHAWAARHARVVLHWVPATRLPRWFQLALQAWVDKRQPARPVASLRAAVAHLRPRSARWRTPSVWMASKGHVRMCAGNPEWRLPPEP